MKLPDSVGIPFVEADASLVDSWSWAIYKELSGWAQACSGRWTRWSPGYLSLEVDRSAGKGIAPALLLTRYGEVEVRFGTCVEAFLRESENEAGEVRKAAGLAKSLIEDWMIGRILVAVLTDPSGNWLGSAMFRRDDSFMEFLRRISDAINIPSESSVEILSADESVHHRIVLDQLWLAGDSGVSINH